MEVVGNAVKTTRNAAWKFLDTPRAQPVRRGLALALGQRRFGRLLLGPRLDAVRKEILGAFVASGSPPSMDGLAKILNRPESELRDEVDALVRRRIISLGEKNVIATAYPFSLTPTPHRVRFAKDRKVYAVSALDALGIALLAGGTGEVHSTCPRTERELRIVLRQGSISERAPDKCVLVVIAGEAKTTGTEAPHRHGQFFASRKDALEWLNTNHPIRGRVLSLRFALLAAKLLFDDRFTLVS